MTAGTQPGGPPPLPWIRRFAGTFLTTEDLTRQDRRTQIIWLSILVPLLVLPFILEFSPGEDGCVSVGSVRLPPACASKRLVRADCPGCGLVRAFTLAAHGQFRDSLRFHRLGLLLYGYFIYQALLRAFCAWKSGRQVPHGLRTVQNVLPWVLIALLFVNWGVGLFTGSNGS